MDTYCHMDGTTLRLECRRKDEEIAKLREELAKVQHVAHSVAVELVTMTERAERAEARNAEAEKQGPLAHIHRTSGNIIEAAFFGNMLPADGNYIHEEFVQKLPLNKSVALYTRPIPPADVAELQERAQFLVDRTGVLEARIAELELAASAEGIRTNMLISEYAQRIAELERKLAEQQATYRKLHEAAKAGGVVFTFFQKQEELNALLAKARAEGYEQGKRDAVPEGWQAVPVDITVEMGQAITESISDIYNSDEVDAAYAAMLAAAPKPEVKQ